MLHLNIFFTNNNARLSYNVTDKYYNYNMDPIARNYFYTLMRVLLLWKKGFGTEFF